MSTNAKRQIRMDLDQELHQRLRVTVAQMDITARAAIRQAIREWIDRMQAEQAEKAA